MVQVGLAGTQALHCLGTAKLWSAQQVCHHAAHLLLDDSIMSMSIIIVRKEMRTAETLDLTFTVGVLDVVTGRTPCGGTPRCTRTPCSARPTPSCSSRCPSSTPSRPVAKLRRDEGTKELAIRICYHLRLQHRSRVIPARSRLRFRLCRY